MGPAAYDVASLLQDARVDVPELIEIGLLSRYTRARRSADAAFDAPAFARAYATLAAQRASKILGIFARLWYRDGKRAYLADLPNAEMHRLVGGHFAVEDNLDYIAARMIGFYDERVAHPQQSARQTARGS